MNFISQLQCNKNIQLASHAGFCYGVKRAVETTKKLKIENPEKNIFVLGELIHNSEVIKELNELGIMTVNELPEDATGICVIRSHGASPSVFENVRSKGLELVDLTCPDVKKVQDKAIHLAQKDYFLIILGKHDHPEVIAIRANALEYATSPDRVFVTHDIESLKKIETKLKKESKIGIVIQTTQKIDYLKEVVDYLAPISKELRVINTICASTSFRQSEARDLALKSDLMLVVGSKKSANTTHLAEILCQITKTIHIEDDIELLKHASEVKNAQNIGITAGASTPEYIIDKVIKTISKGEINGN